MGGGDILVPGLIVSLVLAAGVYLLKRAIDNNDKTQEEMKVAFTSGLEKLSGKLDGLATKDNAHSEAIVELKVRLSTVERELLQTQNMVRRRRSTDEAPT